MEQFPPPRESAVFAQPQAGRGNLRLGRRIAVVVAAIALGAVFVLAAGAFAWVHSEPGLADMLPADVPAAGSTDLSWWWTTGAPLRRLPSVQTALNQWQADQQISIQNDILPWAGQGAVALISYDKQTPQLAFFVQVRDWIAFARFLHRMEGRAPSSKLGSVASKQAATTVYDGVAVQSQIVSDSSGRAPTIMQSAMLHGWFVVGVGEGALPKVLDAYTGKSPTLAKDAAWLSAQRHLPGTSVGWSALHWDKLLPIMVRESATKIAPDKYGYLTVTNFTAPGSEMRWDAVSVPTNATTQNLFAKFAAAQTIKITAATLSSVPNDTVATFITSNAAKQIDTAVDWTNSIYSTFAPTPLLSAHEKAKVAQFSGLSGLAEVNLVVQQNGAGGVSAFADAATPQGASRAESAFIKQSGATPLKNALDKTVPQLSTDFWDSIKLVTSVQGSRVHLATSGGLAAQPLPTGAPYLAFPAEASGAGWYSGGNFRFLTPLRRWMAKQPSAMPGLDQNQAGVDELTSDLALDNAQWAAWARTDPSGAWQQQTTLVTNWDWRAALTRLVDSTIKNERNGGIGMPGMGMPMPLPPAVPHPGGLSRI